MIVAQLSDIHAASDNDNLARLDRALAWLDHIEVSALVISGDLIDNNEWEGYQHIARRLNARAWPTCVLPGNADNREQMQQILGGAGITLTSATTGHFVVREGPLRLIGLDTTLVGDAAGAIGPHLTWLHNTLSSDAGMPTMLFFHHPVIQSGIPTMDDIMCRDHARLKTLLRQHPARPLALAMGHVHRPVMGMFAGIPTFICGSICPANPLWLGTEKVPPVDDPPALMIHRFHQGTLVSHHVSVR